LKNTILVLAIALFALSSCAVNDVSSEDPPESESAESYTAISGDWDVYTSAASLTNAASLVFTGRVTGISFQMLDMLTAQPPTDETRKELNRLNTVFDIDVIMAYKGDISGSTLFRIDSGMKGYREGEQMALTQSRTVSFWSEMPEIQIGETYLFVLYQQEGHIPYPINIDQFSYHLGDPFAADSFRVSAKSVVSHFGTDKWDDFWADWKQDNRDWQTRLSGESLEAALAAEREAMSR
jgi:hypothetical protein